MKKLLSLGLSLAMAAVLFGCGGSPAPAPTEAPAATDAPATDATEAPAATEAAVEQTEAPAAPAEGLKVAGVVFQEDQFMKLLQMGYADAAKAAGAEFLPGNTNNDVGKESELLNTYITQGINGLAITPISEESSIAALNACDAAGIKVGLSNTSYKDAQYVTGVYTSDNFQLGATTGKACKAFIESKLGGKANIAILQFKSLLPEQSAARSDGFLSELKDLGDNVKVVTDQDAWLQDKAITVAGDILTANPDINIIFAANEGGTIGATMAVKNAGLAGKVYVFGFDASDQLIQMLQDPDDVLQAVTGQDPYNIGVKTMESVIKTIKGEANPDAGQVVIVPGTLLSRDNPDGLKAFQDDLKAKMGG